VPNAYNAVDREPVWAALFALLKRIPNQLFTITSRQHTQPPTLAPEMQPGLFLIQARETRTPRPAGFPVKITLNGFLVVYFQSPQPLVDEIGAETMVGATQLNALLAAIDTALIPDNVATGKLTLGGMVEHCWIEGDIDMDTGIYGQQGAAILPIKMLVP
jgi:hypothetical protein